MGNYYFCLEKNDCLANHGFCRFCRFAKSAKSARPPGNRQVAKREAFFKHDAATLLAVGIAARHVSFLSRLPLSVEPFTFLLLASFARQLACFAGYFGEFAEFADFADFADFCRFLQILQILQIFCRSERATVALVKLKLLVIDISFVHSDRSEDRGSGTEKISFPGHFP